MEKNIFSNEDKKFMHMAYMLAEKGRGTTSPNPMVGAVIVKDGRLISSGYHKMAGTPHAEINAINAAKEIPRGSRIYVTLEPCSFYGKTPPCTDALIRYGFSEVIIGALDPNPMVNGKGARILEKAKISVKTGLLEEKIIKQNEIFFKHITMKNPFVCVKMAASIDGKLAASSGDSKWITGIESRSLVQHIRFGYGCILTGINTVAGDDPLLFPRKNISRKFNPGTLKDLNKAIISRKIAINNQPGAAGLTSYDYSRFFRAILDSKLRLDLNSGIVKTAKYIKTILFISEETGQDRKNSDKISELISLGFEIAPVRYSINMYNHENNKNKECRNTFSRENTGGGPDKLDLKSILNYLYAKHEITSVLVEAGPTLVASFLEEKLVDKFLIFLAPKIIGGESRYDMFPSLNIKNMNDALDLKFDGIKKIGPDLMLEAYPVGLQVY